MTDSMNFGPEWLRNLSSDGSTTGGTGGGSRYQLSGYRYGREEMLGLYEKGFKPPASLVNFTRLYTDPPLVPLVLTATTEEERLWQSRAPPLNSSTRGSRGSSLERGGTRPNRGRGSYQYGRNVNTYDASGGVGGWGNGEQQEWSPRKDYGGYSRSASVDNWRRNRPADEEEGWRSTNNRGPTEKWVRSTSWRDGDKEDDRGGPHERSRSWFDGRNHVQRKGWDEDHQPEWFTEQLGEGGGTFDSTGAYHGSDDEQDHRVGGRKELQKSASQQNISPRQPAPLTSSKSSVSLSKQCEIEVKEENINIGKKEAEETKEKLDPPEKPIDEKKPKNIEIKKEVKVDKIEKQMGHKNEGNTNVNGIVIDQPPPSSHRVEEDFDRLQEDLVSKLVVEEENPKTTMNPNMGMSSVGVTPQPPPNLVPPIQDKWYYQDPQGDLQGPFVSTEMAEWFKAGYFTLSLLVRRQCDKTFYTLGDLVRLCNGVNPFLSTTRIPPLKEVPPVKLPDQDHLLNLHNLQVQFALRQGRPYKSVNPTDWANLTALQQRDMLAQHLIPPAQMTPVDLQYFQQSAQPPPQAANPLMHIINQMQQVNKLSGPPMTEQPNAIPMQLDPLQALVQQMHSLQRIPQGATPLPGMGLPQTIPSENLINNMTGIHGNLPGPGMTGIPSSLPGSGVMPTIPQKPLENLATTADDNPINNLLRQLQNKNISQPQPMDSLWQQNQYITSQIQQPNQWQQQQQPTVQSNQPQQPTVVQPQQQPPPTSQQQQPPPNEAPISMWDLTPTPSQMNANQQPVETITSPSSEEIQQQSPQNREKEQSKKEKEAAKEEKKRKEQEEKQLKKEAEEKRKQEQRKQEMEKKAAEEKKKKEEERIRKELEKARKEAEEKRLRELEEKRKLKEARKAEEEARKRAEEQKRLEEDHEKEKMKEETKRAMAKVIQENQCKNNNVVSKAAPWSNPSSVATGPSLLDIQKAEREKRVELAYLQQQQRQTLMQEQQTIEKATMQFNWANKPVQPRQVKSLAEIQAEEQELLAKQAAERLAQQHKEKENQTAPVSSGIWQGQNLTWANTASQWSSNAGFWDDAPTQKAPSKPSNVVKSNSTSAMVIQSKTQQQQHQQQQQQPKVAKAKTKKEETAGSKNNGSVSTNGPATEEFTQWCIKALSNVTSTVDIPTFIGFLKDIESAADVKDYCREYLGESQAMHQFTAQFLEKRRSFRPKTNAHKDDMCSPAPAITPSMQHNSDFQEVKGKGKKTKKSKMTKVDARILGFNVTAAQDRINVGDRDYGDN